MRWRIGLSSMGFRGGLDRPRMIPVGPGNVRLSGVIQAPRAPRDQMLLALKMLPSRLTTQRPLPAGVLTSMW